MVLDIPLFSLDVSVLLTTVCAHLVTSNIAKALHGASVLDGVGMMVILGMAVQAFESSEVFVTAQLGTQNIGLAIRVTR